MLQRMLENDDEKVREAAVPLLRDYLRECGAGQPVLAMLAERLDPDRDYVPSLMTLGQATCWREDSRLNCWPN